MIEELKLVLDSIGDLTGVALWVVGFFIVFKLVVYLSTTGAVVYILKLGINRIYEVLTREQVVKYKFGDHFIDSGVRDDFESLLNECKMSTGRYIHSSDLAKIKAALEAIGK